MTPPMSGDDALFDYGNIRSPYAPDLVFDARTQQVLYGRTVIGEWVSRPSCGQEVILADLFLLDGEREVIEAKGVNGLHDLILAFLHSRRSIPYRGLTGFWLGVFKKHLAHLKEYNSDYAAMVGSTVAYTSPHSVFEFRDIIAVVDDVLLSAWQDTSPPRTTSGALGDKAALDVLLTIFNLRHHCVVASVVARCLGDPVDSKNAS